MIELRDYQRDAVSEVREAFRSHRRVCLQLPVGAGKTVVAAHIMAAVVARNERVLFLVHRRELIMQAVERLRAYAAIEPGIILAGEPEPPDRPAQIASIQTLARRVKPAARLLIIDEAHHAVAESYMNLLACYPGAFVLGLTATPARLDGRGLSDVFDHLVSGISVASLIEQGVLVKPRTFGPSSPDLSGVHTLAGEYNQAEVEPIMGTLVGDVVSHWKRLAEGRRTVVFCVSVAHSLLVCAAFRREGVSAEHIDGSTPKAVREEALARLAAGETTVLCNCELLGEGWDLPALEVAVLARPTASLVVHRQQIGRIMRAAENKDGALVLDHSGNTKRHGFIDEPIAWSLDGKKKLERIGPLVKTCKVCYAICQLHDSVCMECGTAFPVTAAPSDVPDTVEGLLHEYHQKSPWEQRLTFYREQVTEASRLQRRLGWARNRYRERFGEWPRFMNDIEDTYACPGHEFEEKVYGRRKIIRCGYCLDDQSGARKDAHGQ